MSYKKKNKKGKRDVETQTCDTDVRLEILHLQEQVRLLTIENEHFRKYVPILPDTNSNNVDKILKPVELNQRNSVIQSARKKNNNIKIYACTCKGTCSSKQCGCVKRDTRCGESCRCSNACQNQDSNFNPMKPKHELARTPVRASTDTSSHDISNISLTVSVNTIKDERVPTPAGELEKLSQPEVNWEEYQSQLVACHKCKRKFHPLRIEKHESCCKNV